jgi:hypothetical protein
MQDAAKLVLPARHCTAISCSWGVAVTELLLPEGSSGSGMKTSGAMTDGRGRAGRILCRGTAGRVLWEWLMEMERRK